MRTRWSWRHMWRSVPCAPLWSRTQATGGGAAVVRWLDRLHHRLGWRRTGYSARTGPVHRPSMPPSSARGSSRRAPGPRCASRSLSAVVRLCSATALRLRPRSGYGKFRSASPSRNFPAATRSDAKQWPAPSKPASTARGRSPITSAHTTRPSVVRCADWRMAKALRQA